MADAILPRCTVYALASSEDGIVRYIGQTKKLLADRLRDHINESTSKKKSLKLNWIRQQLRAGNRIVISEVKCDAAWNSDEIEAIKEFRERGFPLLNMTSGGDGVIGLSEESRRQIGLSGIGRVPTERHRKVAGDLMRARWADPEWREKFSSRTPVAKTREAVEKAVKTRMERGGYGHTAESRRKMSDATKQRFADTGNRERTSAATKAAMARPEVRAKLSGESRGFAKLTAESVRAIRAAWAEKSASMREIAAQYGVNQSSVSLIVNRKTWAHLA